MVAAPVAAAGAAKETPRQLVLDALPNGRRLACFARTAAVVVVDGTVLAAAAGAGAAVVGTGRRGCGCGGGRGCSPVPVPGSFGGQRRGCSHLRHHHRSQSHGRCWGR